MKTASRLDLQYLKVALVREERKAIQFDPEPDKPTYIPDMMEAPIPTNVVKVGGAYKQRNITVYA